MLSVQFSTINVLRDVITLNFRSRLGFLIVDECPSVNTENYTPELLKRHKESLSELIRRDKNRPSVVLWSIANEPRTQLAETGVYFKQVAQHTKTLDPSRPITIALSRSVAVIFLSFIHFLFDHKFVKHLSNAELVHL